MQILAGAKPVGTTGGGDSMGFASSLLPACFTSGAGGCTADGTSACDWPQPEHKNADSNSTATKPGPYMLTQA